MDLDVGQRCAVGDALKHARVGAAAFKHLL
jgi:hypothetical protein